MKIRKQKTIFFLLAAIGIAAGLLVNAPLALAQQSDPPQPTATPTALPLREVSDDEVNSVARDLYCPVCSNVPLDVCGTQACADWREVIRQKLAEGRSSDEIKMYFLQRYGDRVLPVPPNPLIYIIPAVVVLAAAIFVVRMLTPKKQAQPVSSAPAAELPADDPYIARLEAELAERKKK